MFQHPCMNLVWTTTQFSDENQAIADRQPSAENPGWLYSHLHDELNIPGKGKVNF